MEIKILLKRTLMITSITFCLSFAPVPKEARKVSASKSIEPIQQKIEADKICSELTYDDFGVRYIKDGVLTPGLQSVCGEYYYFDPMYPGLPYYARVGTFYYGQEFEASADKTCYGCIYYKKFHVAAGKPPYRYFHTYGTYLTGIHDLYGVKTYFDSYGRLYAASGEQTKMEDFLYNLYKFVNIFYTGTSVEFRVELLEDTIDRSMIQETTYTIYSGNKITSVETDFLSPVDLVAISGIKGQLSSRSPSHEFEGEKTHIFYSASLSFTPDPQELLQLGLDLDAFVPSYQNLGVLEEFKARIIKMKKVLTLSEEIEAKYQGAISRYNNFLLQEEAKIEAGLVKPSSEISFRLEHGASLAFLALLPALLYAIKRIKI